MLERSKFAFNAIIKNFSIELSSIVSIDFYDMKKFQQVAWIKSEFD